MKGGTAKEEELLKDLEKQFLLARTFARRIPYEGEEADPRWLGYVPTDREDDFRGTTDLMTGAYPPWFRLPDPFRPPHYVGIK